MSAVEITIFAVALLGAVLGIVNFWYSQQSRRVRIRVIPKLAFDVAGVRYTCREWNKYAQRLQDDSANKQWMIDVVNLSSFGVTIDEIGFSDRTEAGTFAMVHPEISRGKTWPVRLRPREKAVFYSTDGALLPQQVWAHPHAYAKTDCGLCVYGTSPILQYAGKNRSLVS